jgi:hypothetical protein
MAGVTMWGWEAPVGVRAGRVAGRAAAGRRPVMATRAEAPEGRVPVQRRLRVLQVPAQARAAATAEQPQQPVRAAGHLAWRLSRIVTYCD